MFFRLPDIFYTKPTDPTHILKYGNKPAHTIRVRIPNTAGPHPLLYTIHGGQWKSAYTAKQLEYLCEDLKQHGIATCNLEFRRLGHQFGGYPGTYDDLDAAIASTKPHLADWNINQERISVLGHSSGGHLAFTLQGYNGFGFTPYALIGVAAVYNLDKITGKFGQVVNEFFGTSPRLSPINITQPATTKQLVIVGSKDKLVDQAQEYVDKNPQATHKVINKASHFTIIDPSSETWPETRQAILGAIV